MRETIDRLLKGDVNILAYYKAAAAMWDRIMSAPGGRDPDTLAGLLSAEQTRLEVECNMDRRLVQEIIAVAGIARLYNVDRGFDRSYTGEPGHAGDVLLVQMAIDRSSCSSEVKYAAERVAGVYGLKPAPKRGGE